MKTRWAVALIALCAGVAGLFAMRASYLDERSPALLRVGILPNQSEEVLRKQYAPFLEYLSAATGVDVRLVIPGDYGELADFVGGHEVDLAYFGGLTFVRAHVRYGVVPLVMRQADMRFTSSFLAGGGDAGDDLADFEGGVFAFGSPLSTSGHLMPRHFMKSDMQIAPEDFFSEVRYSSTHDSTVYLVRDGLVDVGVANTQIIKSMIADGRLREGDVRILWQTPPYINYVWAVDRHLTESLKTRLRDAFLALRPGDGRHREVLDSLQAEVFLPVGSSDFLPLQQIADNLGLLDGQVQ